MIDEKQFDLAKKIYRKAVRRDFFRRKAIIRKVMNLLSQAGVFTPGHRGGTWSEQSVAGLGAGERKRPTPDFLPLNGAEIKDLGCKTKGVSHDGNMGQTNHLPPSIICDVPTDGHQGQLTGAADPVREQMPAQTEEEEQPTSRWASLDK